MTSTEREGEEQGEPEEGRLTTTTTKELQLLSLHCSKRLPMRAMQGVCLTLQWALFVSLQIIGAPEAVLLSLSLFASRIQYRPPGRRRGASAIP